MSTTTLDGVQITDGTITQDKLDSGLSLGGLVLLGSYTASADATVDIGSGLDLDAAIDSTYDVYIVSFSGVTFSASGGRLVVRTSTDAGSTFDSGGTDYGGIQYGVPIDTGTIFDNGSTTNSIDIGGPTSSTATSSMNGQLYLYAPSNAALHTQVMAQTIFQDNNDDFTHQTSGGVRLAAEDVDAIRFINASANTSGEFKLYGVAKS